VHEIGPDAELFEVLAHPAERFLAAGRQRAIVVGEVGILPARLGMADEHEAMRDVTHDKSVLSAVGGRRSRFP
jgi:hypothetical protein